MDRQVNFSITSLPDEIIILILQNNNCTDIIRFGITCKQFYYLVCNNQLLWKNKLKDLIPTDIFDVIDKHTENNWLQEVKTIKKLKNSVLKELLLMSPKCYWQLSDICFEGVGVFFNISLTNNISYYYVIYMLQHFIRKGKQHLNKHFLVEPYSLTNIYYARTVLSHLINTYLTVKWVQKQLSDKLHPEFVLNFFIQWVDSISMHSQEDVDNVISNLAAQVEMIILKQPITACTFGSKLKNMVEKGEISECQILKAITQVIYHQPHMAVTVTANLDTLDIIKVINNKCGNVIALGAIYQAVARRCGVCCHLIAFPDHLFVEWRDSSNNRNLQRYTIDLGSGELKQMRVCPFSRFRNNPLSTYRPDSLLAFIVASYNNTMGAINDWSTKNAAQLIGFTSNTLAHVNEYGIFMKELLANSHVAFVCTPINIKNFEEINKHVILWLINDVLPNTTTKRLLRKIKSVHKRDSRVRYAVGMICLHKKSGYMGVIRGWDPTFSSTRPPTVDRYEYGLEQPFYNLVTMDQSDRYVAQEHLTEVVQPNRLYHLEDAIAREFSHFNGFAYVPNTEKRLEYPDDDAYVSVYQNRADITLREKFRSLSDNKTC